MMPVTFGPAGGQGTRLVGTSVAPARVVAFPD
jgi:hypothetical protein